MRIMKERGFNPLTDVDVESVTFGPQLMVAFGAGAFVANTKPDILLLDICMPDRDDGADYETVCGTSIGEVRVSSFSEGSLRVARRRPVAPELVFDADRKAKVEVERGASMACRLDTRTSPMRFDAGCRKMADGRQKALQG